MDIDVKKFRYDKSHAIQASNHRKPRHCHEYIKCMTSSFIFQIYPAG